MHLTFIKGAAKFLKAINPGGKNVPLRRWGLVKKEGGNNNFSCPNLIFFLALIQNFE